MNTVWHATLLSLFVVYACAVSMYPLPAVGKYELGHCGRYCFYSDPLGVDAYSFKLRGYLISTIFTIEAGALYLQGSGEQFFVQPFDSYVDNSIGGAPADSGIFFGLYTGASPIDGLLQIQSQAYYMATWNKVGYFGDTRLDRLNSFQVVMTTDSVNTYACFIYPDDIATGNPNGGIDWASQSLTGVYIGFAFPGYSYSVPVGSKTGIDGVPGDGPPASFTGTHSPGQFCFFISGPTAVTLGPASITSPSSGSFFNSVSIASVSLVAQGLLNSRDYTIKVNGLTFSTITSTSLATISSTLNLSSYPDGALVISLFRNSDSSTSASVSINKDTVPPSVSITSPSSGALIRSTLLTVRGTGDPGVTVVVTISDSDASTSNVVSSTVTIGASGTWEIAGIDISTLSDGPASLSASLRDPAGNTGSSEVRFTIDARVAVSITSPSSGSFVNSLTSSSLSVTGRGDASGEVVLTATDSQGRSITAPTTVSVSQNWGLTLSLASLADGLVTLVASITDPAGNQAVSTNVLLTKDTFTSVTITSPAGGTYINSYNVASLLVSGTGEVGSFVVVNGIDSSSSTPNFQSPPVQVSAQGSWLISADLSSLAEGNVLVSATITDSAGNTLTSNTLTLIKDTVSNSYISSPSNLQFLVSAARAPAVTIAGYGDVGTSVFVTVSDSDPTTQNVVSPTVTVSPVGTWSVTVSVVVLRDGLLTIIAATTDLAGNLGTSTAVNLNKDTAISEFAVTQPTAGSSITQSQAASLLLEGTGEAGGRISLRLASDNRGLISKTVIVESTGTWSATVNISSFPNGWITISGTASDLAGNSGSISDVRVLKG